MTKNEDHDASVLPPSRRIADELREKITSGQLPEGARLSSERELVAQYGTARNTARAAVQILIDEGLVIVEHGRGAFVRTSKPLVRLGNDRYSHKYREGGLSPFLLECQRQGKTGRFQVLNIDRREPPRDIAERLGLSADSSSVLRRENIFFADDDPVQYVTTFIPWEIAEGTGLMEESVPHPYGIHGVFEDKGFVMNRIREEVTSRMPTPAERSYLQVPPGVPVIDVLHVSVDAHERAYEVTRFVLRADMNGLLYDTPVE